MAKKLLLAGTIGVLLLLLIGFVVFVSYRQQQLASGQSLTDQSFLSIFFPGEEEPPKQGGKTKQEAQAEFFSGPKGIERYNTTVIQRGQVGSYDESQQVLQFYSDYSKRDVSISTSEVTAVQCWPESVTNANGSVTFLREAYIPFAPNQPLQWSGSVRKPQEEVLPNLTPDMYVIVRLQDLLNTVDQSLNKAEEIVVLGC